MMEWDHDNSCTRPTAFSIQQAVLWWPARSLLAVFKDWCFLCLRVSETVLFTFTLIRTHLLPLKANKCLHRPTPVSFYTKVLNYASWHWHQCQRASAPPFICSQYKHVVVSCGVLAQDMYILHCVWWKRTRLCCKMHPVHPIMKLASAFWDLEGVCTIDASSGWLGTRSEKLLKALMDKTVIILYFSPLF